MTTEPSDLVERERAYGMALASTQGDHPWDYVARDAAASINRCCDELTRLRTQVDAMAEALEKIVACDQPIDIVDVMNPTARETIEIARQALSTYRKTPNDVG